MRLLDWTLLRSFHSTEWGLPSARTVRYFFPLRAFVCSVVSLSPSEFAQGICISCIVLRRINITRASNLLMVAVVREQEMGTRYYRRYDKHSGTLSEGAMRTKQPKGNRSINVHSGGEVTSAPTGGLTTTTTAASAISTTPSGLLNIVLGVHTWWGEQYLGSRILGYDVIRAHF
jgi:hypothetical protein